MVRAAPPPALVVFSAPVRVRGKDDFRFRADLAITHDKDKNALLAVLSSLMSMLEASSLVTIALICHFDQHTCWPV